MIAHGLSSAFFIISRRGGVEKKSVLKKIKHQMQNRKCDFGKLKLIIQMHFKPEMLAKRSRTAFISSSVGVVLGIFSAMSSELYFDFA